MSERILSRAEVKLNKAKDIVKWCPANLEWHVASLRKTLLAYMDIAEAAKDEAHLQIVYYGPKLRAALEKVPKGETNGEI